MKNTYDKPFKSRISGSDLSNYDSNLDLNEVADGMIHHIWDGVFTKPPHFAMVTKNQLIWGNSLCFQDLPKGHNFRIGFVSGWDHKLRKKNPAHIAGRLPTNEECAQSVRNFGLALEIPHPSLFSLLQKRFSLAEKEIIKGGLPIYALPFRHYIDPTNGTKKKPSWSRYTSYSSNMVVGYLFYCSDEERFSIFKKYINRPETSLIEKKNVERTKEDAPQIIAEQIQRADKTLKNQYERQLRLAEASLQTITTGLEGTDWDALKAPDTKDD